MESLLRSLQQRAMQQLRTLRASSAIRPQQHQARFGERRFMSQLTRTRAQPRQTTSFFTSSSSSKRGVTFPRSRILLSSFLGPFRRGVTRNYATAAPVSEQNLSLSQRLKKLSREYGWSALGVYLTLSALDFPFCFLAVRLLGTDRIGHWEHVVVSFVKEWIAVVWPQGVDVVDGVEQGGKRILEEGVQTIEGVMQAEGQGKRILEEGKETESEEYGVIQHGYKEAEEANKRDNASLWTQLALAYAIHKSFIFVRVPLTAAVTPKVVKTLRGWGWNIGKRPVKSTASPSTGSGTGTAASGTGVNTKGSGVKND